MDHERVAAALVDGAKKYIDQRLASFEKRLAALETKSFRFRGVWQAPETYKRGDLATHDGSLWHCNAESTTGRPGDGSTDWTLAVKRGKDAR